MRSPLRRVGILLRLIAHLLFGVIAAHLGLRLINTLRHDRRSRYQQAASRWWNRGLCRILNLNIHCVGEVNPGITLFVANHISWLDITCLAATLKAHFVAKQEVRDWPVFGAMVAQADTLFLERGNADATLVMANRMTWSLIQKKNLVMFPEGTSSDGTSVMPFHARLFQAAIRARAQVQSVTITYPHPHGVNPLAPFIGDDNLLHHLWALLGDSAIDVTLTFGNPLTAEGMERRALAQRARAQVLANLADVGGDDRQELSA